MSDFFGADTAVLKKKKLWLFDMDGTIYEENRLFDGARELLTLIKEQGGRYVFITNNSSKSVSDYVHKIKDLGIKAGQDNFFTASQATALWLHQNHANAKVYCQGTESLILELTKAGINVTQKVEPVDVVLVGFDTELSYEKLRATCEILSTQDAVFVATNPDLACPVSFGFIPDCGSICHMIENATGKTPIYIGKPEPAMVDIVRKKFGISKEQTVVVGDRMYTDIAVGINAGVSTICVLTGETSVKDIENSDKKPEYTFHSVKEVYWAIKETSDFRQDQKAFLSARGEKIAFDICRCNRYVQSGHADSLGNDSKTFSQSDIASFCHSMAEEYCLNEITGTETEKLQSVKTQLTWAIRML